MCADEPGGQACKQLDTGLKIQGGFSAGLVLGEICAVAPALCGYLALGGILTSGQPTIKDVNDTVLACFGPESQRDVLVCSMGTGALVSGSFNALPALASIPKSGALRAAVMSIAIEEAPMSVPPGTVVRMGATPLPPASRPPPVSPPLYTRGPFSFVP